MRQRPRAYVRSRCSSRGTTDIFDGRRFRCPNCDATLYSGHMQQFELDAVLYRLDLERWWNAI